MSSQNVDQIAASYRECVEAFYEYLPEEVRHVFVEDAMYHKARYLDLLSQQYGADVVELGSDKPFITHYLRTLNPASRFHTISIDIPHSPYPVIRIDIESEPFPFEDESISDVVFTEVLEHLYRDPAWALFQINRVLKTGGRLFLTTPNACGYDVLVNLLHQTNPNGRNQFYAAMESGHPHLWTASECRLLLEAHGMQVQELSTVDYYPIPLTEKVSTFLAETSPHPELHGQVIRIIAEKRTHATQPVYPLELFPEGKPVQFTGALRRWAERQV